jgi:4-hydroxy-3-methylbut-2-enyl diphosphate reductase
MLAEETHEIAQMMKQALVARFGEAAIGAHFADTRDTLCYATSENQRSMRALLESTADLAIVVGGYNSSNTSHLVELCEGRVPVFYVQDAEEILISAGASCPDAMVEAVLARVASLFPDSARLAEAV